MGIQLSQKFKFVFLKHFVLRNLENISYVLLILKVKFTYFHTKTCLLVHNLKYMHTYISFILSCLLYNIDVYYVTKFVISTSLHMFYEFDAV